VKDVRGIPPIPINRKKLFEMGMFPKNQFENVVQLVKHHGYFGLTDEKALEIARIVALETSRAIIPDKAYYEALSRKDSYDDLFQRFVNWVQ
jgi:hypothetical protein